jgi:hypothetical protein
MFLGAGNIRYRYILHRYITWMLARMVLWVCGIGRMDIYHNSSYVRLDSRLAIYAFLVSIGTV